MTIESATQTVANGECLISVENVWKRFESLEVLKGVSLDVARGDTAVIIGESGCGKSVLLKHVIGILRPDRGRVMFDHIEISSESERDLAKIRQRFGMVFQGSALFDSMSVRENVAFGLMRHTDYGEEKISRIVATKLRLVGLSGLEEKMPAELSGGMKKRVGIARAIAMDPEVVLYDEPTAGLDPIMSDVINELILRVQISLNTTSVVVTHDMRSAYKIATTIALLKDGQIVESGTPDEIKNSSTAVVQQFIRGEALDRIDSLSA